MSEVLQIDQTKPPTDNLDIQRVMERLPVAELVTDQEGFDRHRFQISERSDPPISIEFRGKEELPVTPDNHQTLHVVATHDERPVRTGEDRYGTWVQARSADESGAVSIMDNPVDKPIDVQLEGLWSRAIEQGAEEVVFHVPSTPKGVMDAAIIVASHGNGDDATLKKLLKMRTELVEGDFSDETLRTMQRLVDVPAALDRRKGESGVMLVVMALTGDAEAEQSVQALEQITRNKYILDRLGKTSVDELIDNENFHEPGDSVSAEAINMAKERGLVVVHTTSTRPLHDRYLRSTAQFNEGTKGQFPRESVHFSLNHAVSNNLGGNFDGRPYTIVAPLSGMLEANGTPSAMADVDTFFTNKPGEAIILPQGTTIVEMVDDNDIQNGLTIDGSSITVNAAKLETVEGIKQLADEFMALFPNESLLSDNTFYPFVYSLMGDGGVDLMQELYNVGRAIEHPLVGRDIQPLKSEQEDLMKATKDHIQNEKVNLTDVLDDPEAVNENATLKKLLSEALRVAVVGKLTRALGGKFVKGGSHYTFDSAFQDSTREVAKEMHVTTMLHSNTSEGWFEQQYGEALSRSTRYVEAGNERRAGDFDWTTYADNEHLLVAASHVPPSVKVRAAQMGILTYAKKSKVQIEENDEFNFL